MSNGTSAESIVLVVDDDYQVRDLITTALAGTGVQVLQAASGEEAIATYQDHHSKIGLVLLDVVMPWMDGPATLVELGRLNPAVRCCLVSTRADEFSDEELLTMGALACLQKPFRVGELVNLVGRLMQTTAAPVH
jgi:DNA-binding response OmpR family regulator